MAANGLGEGFDVLRIRQVDPTADEFAMGWDIGGNHMRAGPDRFDHRQR